ncbi:MAG: YbaK/EbsC family protein [Halovenus sp.]
MHPRAQECAGQVAEQFDEDIAVTEFEAGTETAADAADAIGCDVAQIASSLVFLVDDDPIVVVASGTTHVSEDRLATQQDGESVTLADPETVEATCQGHESARHGPSFGPVGRVDGSGFESQRPPVPSLVVN